jgi:hypothetical protein
MRFEGLPELAVSRRVETICGLWRRCACRLVITGLLCLSQASVATAQSSAADHIQDLVYRSCRTTPTSTDAFCTCLAREAIGELDIAAVEQLMIVLTFPSIVDLDKPPSRERLGPESDRIIGSFLRAAIPKCRSTLR